MNDPIPIALIRYRTGQAILYDDSESVVSHNTNTWCSEHGPLDKDRDRSNDQTTAVCTHGDHVPRDEHDRPTIPTFEPMHLGIEALLDDERLHEIALEKSE